MTHRCRFGGPHTGLVALALFAASPATALPWISEVFYDAVGSDDGLVFVELWGPPGTSLEGLRLEGVNGSNGSVGPVIDLFGSIPADGLFVIADQRSDGTSDVAEADAFARFDFQNGPDSVQLLDELGVVDALGYGDFDPGEVFAGEGLPAPDAGSGSSLARRFANVDRDDNALDFVVLEMPTPGVAPLAVPEPGAASLTLAGLAGLGGLSRRQRRRRAGL